MKANGAPAVGQRVVLTGDMRDDPDPLPVGAAGTVRWVNHVGSGFQVSVDWDEPHAHRTLMLLSEDPFTVEG